MRPSGPLRLERRRPPRRPSTPSLRTRAPNSALQHSLPPVCVRQVFHVNPVQPSQRNRERFQRHSTRQVLSSTPVDRPCPPPALRRRTACTFHGKPPLRTIGSAQ